MHQYHNHISNYHPQYSIQFPQYPESKIWAEQQIKQPFEITSVKYYCPFCKIWIRKSKRYVYVHALEEVAAMTYLIGKGIDPQTTYITNRILGN